MNTKLHRLPSPDSPTPALTRRRALHLAVGAGAGALLPSAAGANPLALEVLYILGEFALAVGANVVSSFVYDYLKSDGSSGGASGSAPPAPTYSAAAIASAQEHHAEMRGKGFTRTEARTYVLPGLAFYGIEHTCKPDGCVICIGSQGASCLGAPAVLAMQRAADDLLKKQLVTPRQHVGLALLPKYPIDIGGLAESYTLDYESDGFMVHLSYDMHSYSASTGVAAGRVALALTRPGAAMSLYKGVYDV